MKRKPGVVLFTAVLLSCFMPLVVSNVLSATDKSYDVDLGGVKSPYTEVTLSALRSLLLSTKKAEPLAVSALSLQCYQTLGNDFYIGVRQQMLLNASLDTVASIIEDINHYKDLFHDFKDIHISSQIDNLLNTFWEQKVPVFFVPNVKYEMKYVFDRSHADRRAYRYQLTKASDLKASDGFVFLESIDKSHTTYIEYDFFDAEWGAAKIFGKEKVWREAIDDIALSDLAIKAKAENPALSNEQARSEGERQLDKQASRECFEKRVPYQPSSGDR